MESEAAEVFNIGKEPQEAMDLNGRLDLFDSTTVLWGGEFGRSPESERTKGRDHHNTGFSMWLAGGFKGGTIYGATGDIGVKATEKPVHFRGLHARLLHQMGLNQDALNYNASGPQGALDEIARRDFERHYHLTY